MLIAAGLISASAHAIDFAQVGQRLAVEKKEQEALIPQDSIWAAAKLGDWSRVKQLLEQGESVDRPAPNKYALSPLMVALNAKQYKVAEGLIQHGAQANQKSKDGFTALAYAYWAGIGKTPADYDVRYLQLLIRNGADLYASQPWREPLLHLIAGDSPTQPIALKTVLSHQKKIDWIWNQECETPLMKAVYHPEALRLLLQAGANPNAVAADKPNVPSVLLTSAFSKVVEQLPIAGEPLSYRNQSIYKNRQRNTEVEDAALLLLQYGANPRLGYGYAKWPNAATCSEGGYQHLPVLETSPVADEPAAKVTHQNSSAALSHNLAYAAAAPRVFDAIVKQSAPVTPGEIDFSTLHLVTHKYLSNQFNLSAVQAQLGKGEIRPFDDAIHQHEADVWVPWAENLRVLEAQRENFDSALYMLINLRAAINPKIKNTSDNFQNYWTSDYSSGQSLLTLDNLPDVWFARFLAAGASPFIESDNTHDPLYDALTHNNFYRIGLLTAYADIAQKVQPWCERNVRNVVGYYQQGDYSTSNLQTPAYLKSKSAAQGYVKVLLQNPSCINGVELNKQAQRFVTAKG